MYDFLKNLLCVGFVLWGCGRNYLTFLFALTNILHPWINLKVRAPSEGPPSRSKPDYFKLDGTYRAQGAVL